MLKTIRIILWVAVFAALGAFLTKAFLVPGSPVEVLGETDGRVFVQVPWEHLPHVDDFKFTERSGKEFGSDQWAGKPYAINIFFSKCPTICRDFNSRIKSLSYKYRKEPEMKFVSITCDPETDTPEKLSEYAETFHADPQRWLFLTGDLSKIREFGRQSFSVFADTEHHTDDILLVDRWGRYRDRFKWDDPREIDRLDEVLKEVLAETEPPLGKMIKTRNVMAAAESFDPDRIPWVRDFRLTTSANKDFYSRDLTGDVWVASFFFSTCPGICPRQNKRLAELQTRFKEAGIKIVSVTTDPQTDSPAVLRTYAKSLNADTNHWLFLTGQKKYIDRILGEFFKAHSHDGHHSSNLFLVDRWGKLRDKFDWENNEDLEKLFEMAKQLRQEKTPFDRLSSNQK
jgi:protein SCO1/2